ncbi:MAG: flagellar synthesis regulator FleN [Desulfuromonadales bacterium C00003068]|jgi:flagellar biosynthesis protein FlhG|nr:MAG: flagellar synthesis regulator FleN [Desulfuromonadales bacterium C00003068]
MMEANEHADQADTLRSLSDRLNDTPQMNAGGNKTARVLSITSGKGGVGKTAIVSNIAVALGKMGKKVLIIDADLGLANIDVVFGLAPRYNLNHYFSGQQSLVSILVDGPAGIQILPAGSGVQQFTHLDANHKIRFLDDLETLPGDYDVVLIDTEAGISENVTYFNQAAQDILVVTTPEPTAITDAYALMKLLSSKYHEKRFNLIVNSVRHSDEALDVYRKLTMVSNRYLDISIDFMGGIPFDRKMYESVRRQKVMVEMYPGHKVSQAFETLANNLMSQPGDTQPKGSLQFFWKRLLSLGSGT